MERSIAAVDLVACLIESLQHIGEIRQETHHTTQRYVPGSRMIGGDPMEIADEHIRLLSNEEARARKLTGRLLEPRHRAVLRDVAVDPLYVHKQAFHYIEYPRGRDILEALEEDDQRCLRPLLDTLRDAVQALRCKDGVSAAPRSSDPGAATADPLTRLKDRVRNAYASYLHALSTRPELRKATDRAVYEWLEENGTDPRAELKAYKLPSFGTWTRYIREARNALGSQKNAPRAGRAAGRSIAPASQIE